MNFHSYPPWIHNTSDNKAEKSIFGIVLLQGKIPEGIPQVFIFLKRYLVGHCFQDSHFFCCVSGFSFMAYRNKRIKLVPFVIIYKKRALIVVSLVIKLKNCCKDLV